MGTRDRAAQAGLPPLTGPAPRIDMPAPFRCPACAAPLEPAAVEGAFVRCPYCGATARLADARAPAGTAPADPGPRPSPRAALVAAAVLVAIGALGMVVFLRDAPTAPVETVAPAATPIAPAPLTPEKGRPMEPAVRFGREGTGAGGFTDARAVAVGADGRIYVGEYSGGRIQVFDSAGTFLHQFHAERRMPLLDLEVDRAGVVHVLQGSRVRRYDGATGEPRGALASGGSYADLAPVLDGGYWAVDGFHDLVRLGADGAVRRRLDLREAVDPDASPGRLAVAGDGEIFVTDRWTGEVYRLHPDGRFADRFGVARRIGGAFSQIAVDGRGRVFVSGMDGVRVFDRAGTPLGTLGEADVVFGVAADDARGMLFGAYRNRAEIRGYRLPP